MPKYAHGIAASDYDIGRRDARNLRRQQTVSDVALGVGTMLGALNQFRQKSQRQADAAVQAEILAGMSENPMGRPTGRAAAMPEGVAGPGQEVVQPWEQVIGERMKSYHPPSLIANLGAMFSQLGGSRPEGQLQPQAGAELLALAGNRAFQRSQIELNTTRADAEMRRARAAEATAMAQQSGARDPIVDALVRLRGQSVGSATTLAGQQARMVDPNVWASMTPGVQQLAIMGGRGPGNASELNPLLTGVKTDAALLQKLIFARLGNRAGVRGPGVGAPSQTRMPYVMEDQESELQKLLEDAGVDTKDPNFRVNLQNGAYDHLLENWDPEGGE